MPQIIINGNVVDPVEQAPQMRTKGLIAANAAHSNYILIQTSTRLGKEEKSQLKNLDAQLQEIVCDNTYLLEYKPNDLDAIRNLPFVTWANVYNPEFKVHAELKTPAAQKTLNLVESDHDDHEATQIHTVDIVFHEGIAANSDDVISEIAECANVSQDTLSAGPQKIRVKVQHGCLARLAAIDGVKSIQEVHAMKLFNNKAREVLEANLVDIGNEVYQGEGQVVAVADTGFDMGDKTDTLDAFKGRVLELYPRGSRGKTDDPDGHGTHVAGSVLADGASTILGEGKIQGTAPKAKLALQSLASEEVDENGAPYVGLGGIPDDLRELFDEPYSDSSVNARVHTNSWGPMQTALRYSDTEAYEIDDFVWQKKDMVICFAAGNEGVDQRKADGVIDDGQIGAYAAAKNSITVGASENNRPDVTTTFGQYGYNLQPLKQDRTANNPDGMAAFSNRGYTPEGRVKPDLVAPGTAILSTASRHPQSREGTPLKDPDWRFMDGTSMATPLVAGCAAVIREVLTKQSKLDFIPAALVKALLINGAVELKGQYSPTEAGPSPNTSSGWGRVNLTNTVQAALSDNAVNGYVIGKELDDDEEFTETVTIPTKETSGSYEPGETNGNSINAATLKVTLVWSDPPGSKLQNDLDLIVTDSKGVEYHGNKGETKSEFDRVNNVEQVLWQGISAGEVKVTVRAYQIVRYAQPFALAWSIS